MVVPGRAAPEVRMGRLLLFSPSAYPRSSANLSLHVIERSAWSIPALTCAGTPHRENQGVSVVFDAHSPMSPNSKTLHFS